MKHATQEALVKDSNGTILWKVYSYWLKALEYHCQTESLRLTVCLLLKKIFQN